MGDATQSENLDESFESAKFQDIYTHDGILLKYASASFINELNTSGSLSLIEYPYPTKRFFIEWRPTENILITDEDSQEQDWSLVDTISKRRRTASESIAFNTKLETPPKQKPFLRVPLSELRFIEITSRGQNMVLVKKSGTPHSEFLFQNGNPDSFVGVLKQLFAVQKMRHHRNMYEVVDTDAEKLRKTFAELDIDEIKSTSGSWLSNIVEKQMDFFAKVTDFIPHSQTSAESSPLSPVKPDEYEVLNTEKTDGGAEKSDDDDQNHTQRKPKNNIELPQRKIKKRGSPLMEKQWREFQTEDGRISDPPRIKEIIFRGGIERRLRPEVWKYLLNYYQWDDTTIDRAERKRRKTSEYYQMKTQWLSMSATQERNFSGYRDRKCQIEKDVKRTDRTLDYFSGEENPNLGILQDILMTYVMYNFDLGYVQGMSDLLAPLLVTIQNEADSFWCFVGFMDMVFTNFDIDQAGMKHQLKQLNSLIKFSQPLLFDYLEEHGSENMYFCFRWLLVWFKREFSNNAILTLWECLWTGLPCPNFHLFICLAILDKETDTIIDSKFEFNEILKHVNELSMKIDVADTIEVAEAIYDQIKSSEALTDEIRVIIGEEVIGNAESRAEGQEEIEDNFDNIVNEPTADELEIRRKKLDEACEQSMLYTFL